MSRYLSIQVLRRSHISCEISGTSTGGSPCITAKRWPARKSATAPSVGFGSFRRNQHRRYYMPVFLTGHSPFSEFLTLSTVSSRLGLVALFHATSALRILVFRALFHAASGWHLSMLRPLLAFGQRNSRIDPREFAPEIGGFHILSIPSLNIRTSKSCHQQRRQSTSTQFRQTLRPHSTEWAANTRIRDMWQDTPFRVPTWFERCTETPLSGFRPRLQSLVPAECSRHHRRSYPPMRPMLSWPSPLRGMQVRTLHRSAPLVFFGCPPVPVTRNLWKTANFRVLIRPNRDCTFSSTAILREVFHLVRSSWLHCI